MNRTTAVAAALALLACGTVRPGGPAAASPTGFVPTASAGRLAYWALGRGRDTVVVLHGFQGHGSGYLRPDLAPLGTAGRTLIVYDQRGDGWSGGGTSAADSTPFGLAARVADLEAVRRHFGLERLTLLAHSGGAAVAVGYAAQHPAHVARLLLIAPPPPTREPFGTEAARAFALRIDSAARARAAAHQASLATAPDPRAACRAVVGIVLPAYLAEPAGGRRMRGDFCGGDPEALRSHPARLAAFRGSLPTDWRASATRVLAPTLVMHGDRDAVPVAASRAWAASLPTARLLVIARADHLPWVEQPARVFGAASAFFAGRWPDGAAAVP